MGGLALPGRPHPVHPAGGPADTPLLLHRPGRRRNGIASSRAGVLVVLLTGLRRRLRDRADRPQERGHVDLQRGLRRHDARFRHGRSQC